MVTNVAGLNLRGTRRVQDRNSDRSHRAAEDLSKVRNEEIENEPLHNPKSLHRIPTALRDRKRMLLKLFFRLLPVTTRFRNV